MMIRPTEAGSQAYTPGEAGAPRRGRLAALRDALGALHPAELGAEPHPRIGTVLRGICEQARRERVPVERALVAVKEVLEADIPLLGPPHAEVRRRFIDRTVSLFIQEFYASPPRGEGGRRADVEGPLEPEVGPGERAGMVRRLRALEAAHRRCVGDAHQRVLISEMIGYYRAWCRDNGHGDPGVRPGDSFGRRRASIIDRGEPAMGSDGGWTGPRRP